ncbi:MULTISPECIES: glycosyltransferase family 4 protein [unclassified Sporolactobacillus]|uniref:glycosyltransferase family 4 protein n=1 Tax=unclassified Sporolactobacillus TaxID=2628533 RepID=UPI002368E686|nr:glycosyltransferase family 4 protein [Sporolactobacillus sp. CQH2019]MDD9147983.1 glycosyltransferase family 4 protein [Sporolactobacillus sp. CQH2019]
MSYQVAYVSTYPPKKCGIATYTYHLRQSVQKAKRDSLADPVVVIKEKGEENPSDSFLKWTIDKNRREDYKKMAEKLNKSSVSVVSLQHEFGIFGGNAGEYILELVRHLKKPLITTFHTVFRSPVEPYASIQREIAKRSARLIVMNHKAINDLALSFQIPKNKITFIPHGTPLPDLNGRTSFRASLGWTDRKVVMTFGFLSRSKGIETILRALPHIAEKVPEVLYVIIGQTHPNVKKQEGESYRKYLKSIISENGLQDHVLMIDKFISERDLVKYITACDLYVTPYPGLQQITSGTLAYAIGLGRPVLTTPYRYAQDLLKGSEELFVPYGDLAAWALKIETMLEDPSLLAGYQKKMERIGMMMSWPQTGKNYDRIFSRLARKATAEPAQSSEADVIAADPS